MPASQEIIRPDTTTKVWADTENPVTISVGGNDTLSYGTTTALGSTLSAGQSLTFYTTVYIRTAGDGAVSLRRYDPWDFPGDDITESELEIFTASPLNVKNFGAVGDGVTDDTAAIQAAIEHATGVSNPGDATSDQDRGPHIYIPPGVYRLADTVDISRAVLLQGGGGSGWFANTILRPDAGVTAIKVWSGPSATPPRGDWSVLRDFAIHAAGKTGAAHGIHMVGRARVENVWIRGMKTNGIHIEGDVPDTNANLWSLSNCTIDTCDQHGVYVEGNDANAGSATQVNCSTNAGWGFYDNSFLGNTYVNCHTADNTLGGYKAVGAGVNTSAFINCYTEGGQLNQIDAPNITLGNAAYKGTSTGPYIESDGTNGHWRSTPVKVHTGDGSVTDDYAQLGHRQSEHIALLVNHATDGDWALQWSGNRLCWVHAGSGSRHAIEFSGTTAAEGPGQCILPNGAYVGAASIAPRLVSGNDTPEGAVAAKVGSVFLRMNGAAGTSLYVKETGTGNTGWVAVGLSQTGAADTASTAAMPAPTTPLVKVSGTADITSITAGAAGQTVIYKFASTAATNGVVDGSNLKLTGNLLYTADDTLSMVCDGTNWYETARAVN